MRVLGVRFVQMVSLRGVPLPVLAGIVYWTQPVRASEGMGVGGENYLRCDLL